MLRIARRDVVIIIFCIATLFLSLRFYLSFGSILNCELLWWQDEIIEVICMTDHCNVIYVSFHNNRILEGAEWVSCKDLLSRRVKKEVRNVFCTHNDKISIHYLEFCQVNASVWIIIINFFLYNTVWWRYKIISEVIVQVIDFSIQEIIENSDLFIFC